MNIQSIIDGCHDKLYDLQTALDNSEMSQQNGVCYPVEKWLLAAIAAYAETTENKEEISPAITSSGFKQRAFEELTNKAIATIKNGRTAEDFYNGIASDGVSANSSEFTILAQSFCLEQNTNWSSVTSSIKNGDASSLSGDIKGYVSILINKKDEIYKAIEESPNSNSVSESELIKWCTSIIAGFCWSKEAILSFMNDRIGKYFNRWKIDNTDQYFPYAMNTERYTWYRNHALNEDNAKSSLKGGGKDAWKKLVPKIKVYEDEYLSTINSDRYILHKGAYKKVESAGFKLDDKTYKSSGDGSYVRLEDGKTYVNIKDIQSWFEKRGDSFYETFDFQVYTNINDANSQYGKGSPELMNHVARRLNAETEIKDKSKLALYGMGIDCSGFVSRAIVDLMITLHIPYQKQLAVIGPGYGRLKTNATTLRSGGSTELFYYRYSSKTVFSFVPGTVSSEPTGNLNEYLQPGDILMYKKMKVNSDNSLSLVNDGFHILIIKNVSENSFEVLDSTAKDKKGPQSRTFSSLQDIKNARALSRTKSEGVTYETVLSFARPKIFANLSELAPYYINYLKRGGQS